MSTSANALNTNVASLVVGPSSATDNALVRFDGTTGKLIQNSSALLTDGGNILVTGVIADAVNGVTSLTSQGNLFINGGVSSNLSVQTTTPYDMLVTDYIIVMNVAGAASVILPTPTLSRTCIIKDGSGAAATNNITISASPKTIDGALSYVINDNYGGVCLVYNGTQWNAYSDVNSTTSQLTARYLELNQNSTQAITANTITAVQYPNSVKNTFGSNLTISGTGNTTFTNASGADMYVTISASAITDNGSAASTAGWLFLKLNRGLGNNTTIFQTANDGNFNKTLGLSFTCPIFLANTDSFQIGFISNVTQSLGNSASIQSTGQILRSSLIVLQTPGT